MMYWVKINKGAYRSGNRYWVELVAPRTWELTVNSSDVYGPFPSLKAARDKAESLEIDRLAMDAIDQQEAEQDRRFFDQQALVLFGGDRGEG